MAVQQLVYGSQRRCEYFGALARRYVDQRRTYHSIRIYSTVLLWCAPHADCQYSLWFFFRSSQNVIVLMYECQPVIGWARMHSIGSDGVVYNANLKTTQTTLAQAKNQIQYSQQTLCSERSTHLFLDKDSDSPIENFSRLRHLVSERSVQPQSKNLILELFFFGIFRDTDVAPFSIRFTSFSFFSHFFGAFIRLLRQNDVICRTEKKNWKL